MEAFFVMNLNREICDIIHVPKINGIVDYKKVERNRTEAYSNVDVVKLNSPTNIQSVFIGKGALAFYHVPVNGAYSTRGKIKRTNESITGDIISLFNSPYTLNNIEEIYIGKEALASKEFCELLIRFNVLSTSEIESIIKGNAQGGIRYNNSLIEMFLQTAFNEGDKRLYGNNPSRKFPRLMVVAFVSELDEVLASLSSDKETMDKVNSKVARAIVSKTKDIKSGIDTCTWIECIKNDIKRVSPNCVVVESAVKYSKVNKEFKVKDNQYLFDRLVLKPRVDRYKEKNTQEAKIVKEQEIEIERSDVEIEMQNVEDEYGIETAKIVARAVLNMHNNKQEFKQYISENNIKRWCIE